MDRIINELEYKNYLAERIFLDELAAISIKYNGILNESNIQVVQEITIETFLKYIRTIMANIQNAYNKFKATVNDKIWEEIKNKHGKILAEDHKLMVTEVSENDIGVPRTDNIEKFISIIPNAFNEGMINQYSTKLEAIKGLYSYFDEIQDDKAESLRAVVIKNCYTKINQNYVVDSTIIKDYIDFLDNYKSNSDKVANDIRIINSSERSIENLVKQSMESSGEAVKAPTNNPTQGEQQKTTTESFIEMVLENAVETLLSEIKFDTGSQEVKDNKNNINKFISSYFGAITTVLSLKMKTLDQSRRLILNVCRNYIKKGINDNKANTIEPGQTKEVKGTAKEGPTQLTP